MNKINSEIILAIVFFTMAEVLMILGIIGRTPELYVLALVYAIPIIICYVSAKQKLKFPK